MIYGLSKSINLVYNDIIGILNVNNTIEKEARFHEAAMNGDIYWIFIHGMKNNIKWHFNDIIKVYEFLFDPKYFTPRYRRNEIAKTVLNMDWLFKALDLAFINNFDEWNENDLHNLQLPITLFGYLLKHKIKWNFYQCHILIPGQFLREILFPQRLSSTPTSLLSSAEKCLIYHKRFKSMQSLVANGIVIGKYQMKLIKFCLNYAKWNVENEYQGGLKQFSKGFDEDMLSYTMETTEMFHNEIQSFVDNEIKPFVL